MNNHKCTVYNFSPIRNGLICFYHITTTFLPVIVKKELRISDTITEPRSFLFLSQSCVHMIVIVQFVTVRTVRLCADMKFALFFSLTRGLQYLALKQITKYRHVFSHFQIFEINLSRKLFKMLVISRAIFAIQYEFNVR